MSREGKVGVKGHAEYPGLLVQRNDGTIDVNMRVIIGFLRVRSEQRYGGLGGRYAITTRSKNSGSMVLRHELGHNFGNVGEIGLAASALTNTAKGVTVGWKTGNTAPNLTFNDVNNKKADLHDLLEKPTIKYR